MANIRSDNARTIEVDGRGAVWSLIFLEDGNSVVHGPARLKSPGSGSAFKGSGLEKIQAGPSVGAQARLGPAQSLGRGLG